LPFRPSLLYYLPLRALDLRPYNTPLAIITTV
jgi:hypothetical protein